MRLPHGSSWQGVSGRRNVVFVLVPALVALGTVALLSRPLANDAPPQGAGQDDDASPPGVGQDDPGPLRPTVAPPSETTTVIPADGPAEAAVAASETLYDDAPVVLLADEGDVAAHGRASSVAVALGAPLLLVPVAAAGTSTETSRAEQTAIGTETGAPGPVARELTRLDPRAVMTFGDTATAWAQARGRAPVVRAPASVADLAARIGAPVAPAEPLDSVLVLVSRDGAGVAAAATALASGARLTVAADPDPRTDGDVMAAVVERPPERVVAIGNGFGPPGRLRRRLDVAETGVQLPGGGQVVFPGRRFVALYGHPGVPALGVLGEQPLDRAIERAKQRAADYQPLVDEPVVPSLEIIATVASGAPGPDGNYSNEAAVASLRPWVDAAGEAGVYVVLDLQPGRSDFLSQAKRYEELLAEPHVGLALDPEWRLRPDERHGDQIGSVGAAEVNSVVTWLAELTRERNLPQKLLVIHQFRPAMIGDRQRVDTGRDELAVLIHADGFGTPGEKRNTWNRLQPAPPPNVSWGWKNFIDEDQPTFTPGQTLAIEPTPRFVSYQ